MPCSHPRKHSRAALPRPITVLSLASGLLLAAACSTSGPGPGSQGHHHKPVPSRATAAVFNAPVGPRVAGHDTLPVQARFWPKHPGGAVQVQVQQGATWQTVLRGKQDAGGRYLGGLKPAAISPQSKVRITSQRPNGKPIVSPVVTAGAPWRTSVFDDEFSGDVLDPAKWRTRVQKAQGRRLCSTPDEKMVSVRHGHAVLRVQQVGKKTAHCPHGVFHNAMVGTLVPGAPGFPGWSTTYGLFAARIKFEHAPGMHGSFWLQSAPGSQDTGAEIDAAEYYGDGRHDGGLSNLVHYTPTTGELQSSGGIQKSAAALFTDAPSPSRSWHVYSVQWTPKRYVFRIDGVTTFRTHKPIVASNPEFMVLSLLTSDWELPRLKTTKTAMKVDWVRAWKH